MALLKTILNSHPFSFDLPQSIQPTMATCHWPAGQEKHDLDCLWRTKASVPFGAISKKLNRGLRWMRKGQIREKFWRKTLRTKRDLHQRCRAPPPPELQLPSFIDTTVVPTPLLERLPSSTTINHLHPLSLTTTAISIFITTTYTVASPPPSPTTIAISIFVTTTSIIISPPLSLDFHRRAIFINTSSPMLSHHCRATSTASLDHPSTALLPRVRVIDCGWVLSDPMFHLPKLVMPRVRSIQKYQVRFLILCPTMSLSNQVLSHVRSGEKY